MSATKSSGLGAGLGCLVMLLVLLIFYGPVFMPMVIAPGHVTLGWALIWKGLEISFLVVPVPIAAMMVWAVLHERKKEAMRPDTPQKPDPKADLEQAAESFQTPGRRFAKGLAGALALGLLWVFLSLVFGYLLSGLLQCINVSALQEPHEARCLVLARGKTCSLTCEVRGEIVADTSVPRFDELPPAGRRFRAPMRRGRLGEWVLQYGALRVE